MTSMILVVMNVCTPCAEPLGSAARYCPSCGADAVEQGAMAIDRNAIFDEDAPTTHRPAPPMRERTQTLASSTPSSPSCGSFADGRFIPGQLLGGRYRSSRLWGAGRGRSLGMKLHESADRVRLERPLSCEKLVHDGAKREDVAARRDRFAAKLLGPHVLRRPFRDVPGREIGSRPRA